jgi:hypothetical protein
VRCPLRLSGSDGTAENARHDLGTDLFLAAKDARRFDLLVLHDLETRTSYWRHVTAESIVSTGTGAKILVPRANTVDQEHREQLLAVATTQRASGGWEGTAWTGGPALAPRDLLRHPLLAPRLVAPHPNAGRADNCLSGGRLLAQGRLQDAARLG